MLGVGCPGLLLSTHLLNDLAMSLSDHGKPWWVDLELSCFLLIGLDNLIWSLFSYFPFDRSIVWTQVTIHSLLRRICPQIWRVVFILKTSGFIGKVAPNILEDGHSWMTLLFFWVHMNPSWIKYPSTIRIRHNLN